jgi:predicted RNase H-like HicB family nuclease
VLLLNTTGILFNKVKITKLAFNKIIEF